MADNFDPYRYRALQALGAEIDATHAENRQAIQDFKAAIAKNQAFRRAVYSLTRAWEPLFTSARPKA